MRIIIREPRCQIKTTLHKIQSEESLLTEINLSIDFYNEILIKRQYEPYEIDNDTREMRQYLRNLQNRRNRVMERIELYKIDLSLPHPK